MVDGWIHTLYATLREQTILSGRHLGILDLVSCHCMPCQDKQAVEWHTPWAKVYLDPY